MELYSMEALQVCLSLVPNFSLGGIIKIDPGADLTNPAIQQNLRSQVRELNALPYQPSIALFNLIVKSCLYYNSLKSDLARLIFTFGMGFARSRRMTERAWTTRWTALVNRYPAESQFSFLAEDARNLSDLIQILARDGLDLPKLVAEYLGYVEKFFPEDPIMKKLVDQAAHKGMTVPVAITKALSSYPTFGWMHLLATNAVLQSEVEYLMKYFHRIKGDVYAGIKYPGIANNVKNRAYLCVKLQIEIAGDEQLKKYNGIGGLNNKTQIPLRILLDKLVAEYKKTILYEETRRPSLTVLTKYKDQSTSTKAMKELLSQNLLPNDTEEDEDEVDAGGIGGVFKEQPLSSEDSGSDPGAGSHRRKSKRKFSPPKKRPRSPSPRSQKLESRFGTPPRMIERTTHSPTFSVSGLSTQSQIHHVGLDRMRVSTASESIPPFEPQAGTSKILTEIVGDDYLKQNPHELTHMGPLTALESPTTALPRETCQETGTKSSTKGKK
ncbi:uncharacterized protein LOC110831122 isoform X4 [Zootermopsis nevadensis]|uniref:uncharacterized protein LOC110831122 isoform X4 n=1 Tax=Zootermopsis nevadensis TaxID=136037 RepID=UPI000B8E32BF|nr:uncharacterized protein LOC110831122 isoform X4 [Zootermopsis nevadensis]